MGYSEEDIGLVKKKETRRIQETTTKTDSSNGKGVTAALYNNPGNAYTFLSSLIDTLGGRGGGEKGDIWGGERGKVVSDPY